MAHKTTPGKFSRKRRGVLTLEWVLAVTVLVIGVIGGLGAVRNATLLELKQLADVIEMFNVKTQAEMMSEGGGS
jgi:hypothetical protein